MVEAEIQTSAGLEEGLSEQTSGVKADIVDNSCSSWIQRRSISCKSEIESVIRTNRFRLVILCSASVYSDRAAAGSRAFPS